MTNLFDLYIKEYIPLEMEDWPGTTTPDFVIKTGLDWTVGATSLELWHTEMHGAPVTKIVTVGEYSNAEPFALKGHVSPEQAVVIYRELVKPQ